MKVALVASLLVAVMFAGCSDIDNIEPIIDLSPKDDNETPPPPPPPVEDPGLPWEDIPLVNHTADKGITIDVPAGVSALRINVNLTDAKSSFRIDTTVDHAIYLFTGPGPLEPDAPCNARFDADLQHVRIGSYESPGHFVYGSSSTEEHLLLMAAKSAFSAVVFFNGGTTHENDTVYDPLALGGTWQTADGSKEIERTTMFQDNQTFTGRNFVFATIDAKQTYDKEGADEAIADDHAGTLETQFKDSGVCVEDDREQYQLEDNTTTSSTTSVRFGPTLISPGNTTLVMEYDPHDASETSTISWKYTWFEIPDIQA